MPTLGLCVISAKCDDNVRRLIDRYGQYFDELYIQINGGDNLPRSKPHIHFSKFKWVDDFSKARNALLKHVKTDFWFWMDTDDEIVNPESLTNLVQLMSTKGYEMVFMPYYYEYNQSGQPVTMLWRERLIKTSDNLYWQEAVHEEIVSRSGSVKTLRSDSVIIKHAYKTQLESQQSIQRNLGILLKSYEAGDRRPIRLYYIANSYAILNEHQQAIDIFSQLAQLPDQPELNYEALVKLSANYLAQNDFDKAIAYMHQALALDPEPADAYLYLGTLYVQHRPELLGQAIEYLLTGLNKPRRNGFFPSDPTLISYQPYFTLAMAYYNQGKYQLAKSYIDQAAGFNVSEPAFQNINELISLAYQQELYFVGLLAQAKSIKTRPALQAFINDLPWQAAQDLRLRSVLKRARPAKRWPVKSLVFVCYFSAEQWGPDTLSKGMGGSEEAVVYLTVELAKLGWDVTVYSQRSGPLTHKGVSWLPLEAFNPADSFNILVSWRFPALITVLGLTAKRTIVDMHDVPDQPLPPEVLASVDKVFFKSQFHRSLMPELPPEKAVVISNGLVPAQFKPVGIKRRARKVIYASSADRGLVTLLQLWPQVKAQVPQAELVWAYGWDIFDAVHADSPEHQQWKANVQALMNSLGVKDLGRLDHQALVREMMSCSIWAYPTSFQEINCLTALKTQAAGVEPITSGFAALQETVLQKYEAVVKQIDQKPAEVQRFVNRLVYALKHPLPDEDRHHLSRQMLELYNWHDIAKKWDGVLRENW